MDGWKKVTKSQPCPVCGKPDACKVTADGGVALCKRVESGAFESRPGGWHLHRLKEKSSGRDNPPGWRPWTPADASKGKAAEPSSGRFATLDDAVAAACGPDGKVGGLWVYHNLDGSEHSWRVRIDTPDGKRFAPISRKKGAFVLKRRGRVMPLYRLPDIVGDEGGEVVHLAEGEKAADSLVRLGLAATTTPDGAGNAGGCDLTPLAGRDVVVWVDSDDAGRSHGRDVAARLLNLDPPARARIVEIPGLEEGEDVGDWLSQHEDLSDTEKRSRLQAFADAAAVVKPEDVGDAAILVDLSNVPEERVRWLWKGRIARGKLTILAGLGGSGKSTLLSDIAATVSAGLEWPDGSGRAEVGRVLLIAGEDDLSDTVIPRLKLHGADLTRVVAIDGIGRIGEDGKRRVDGFTLADVGELDRTLKRLGDVALVIIDPLGEVMGKLDSHKESEVRAALRELRSVAARHGVAVVIVSHVRKGGAEVSQLRIIGSVGAVNLARQVWMVVSDPADEDRRLMVFAKGNLGTRKGLAFRLVDRGGEHRAVSWEAGEVSETADDVDRRAREMAMPGSDEPVGDRLTEATDFLREELSGGPVPYRELSSRAKEAGIATRTLRRAKEGVGAYSRKSPSGEWAWYIPSDESNGGDPLTRGSVDTLAALATFGDFLGKTQDSKSAKIEGGQDGQDDFPLAKLNCDGSVDGVVVRAETVWREA